LNNLLIKNYSFDIQKNCESLKDLEKLLEVLAMEISEEFKKFNKKSKVFICILLLLKKKILILKTMVKINKTNTISNSNTNTSSLMALSNGARSNDYQTIHNKEVVKSKSFQISKLK
jgi:hypothetical protein